MEVIQRFLLLISPNAKGKTILAKDSISLQIGKELGKWANAALFFMEEKLQSMRFCFYPNIVRQCGEAYLDESNLSILVSRISQFGLSYIQYCFCTQKAINELIKD